MADSISSDSEIYVFEPVFLDSSDESDGEFEGFDPVDFVRPRDVIVKLPFLDFALERDEKF